MKTIRYEVCDETAYGTENGFYASDPELLRVIDDIVVDLIGVKPVSLVPNASAICRACSPYRLCGDTLGVPQQIAEWYTPYPILDGWSDEYKSHCVRLLSEHRYKGYCDVPIDTVKDIIRPAVKLSLDATISDLIDGYASISGVNKSRIKESKADARSAEKAYNDVFNEGGEGYVPRFYTKDEVNHATDQLAYFTDLRNRLRAAE